MLSNVTDLDGKFRIVGIIPGIPVSMTFQQQNNGRLNRINFYKPEPLTNVTLRPGEARELGDLAVTPANQ